MDCSEQIAQLTLSEPLSASPHHFQRTRDVPVEPILSSGNDRFMLFPIKYPKVWDMYLRARNSFWLPSEIDMSSDVREWTTVLNENERRSISRILAFFSTADGIVAENLIERFASEVTVPEVRYFYGFQIAMENIHAETYALLLNSLVDDDRKRLQLLKDTNKSGSISLKTDWALKWINRKDRSFAERLVAFACVEGIFFSSSFAFIFRLKSKSKMRGLCMSNDLISRDEGLHTEFACLLIRGLTNRPDEEVVQSIVRDAVKVEIMFAHETLDPPVLGLNTVNMGLYVMYVADQLLLSMGYRILFGVKNPYQFMTQISLPVRANFFERANTDYTFSSAASDAMLQGLFPPGSFA